MPFWTSRPTPTPPDALEDVFRRISEVEKRTTDLSAQWHDTLATIEKAQGRIERAAQRLERANQAASAANYEATNGSDDHRAPEASSSATRQRILERRRKSSALSQTLRSRS